MLVTQQREAEPDGPAEQSDESSALLPHVQDDSPAAGLPRDVVRGGQVADVPR